MITKYVIPIFDLSRLHVLILVFLIHEFFNYLVYMDAGITSMAGMVVIVTNQANAAEGTKNWRVRFKQSSKHKI